MLSSFSLNQFLQSLLETQILVVPVPHRISSFEITTTLLFPVIPELFYNYGHRNVSLIIKPLTGTQLGWNGKNEQTNVKATALISWIIHEDSTTVNATSSKKLGNVTDLAFKSVLDLDINLTLGVNATKNLQF